MTADGDRHELRQVIAGLSAGVIRVEPDQTIACANEAALSMHGVEGEPRGLAPTLADMSDRFEAGGKARMPRARPPRAAPGRD